MSDKLLFRDVFVEGRGVTRRPWTIVAGFVGQCAMVGCMMLVPLMFTDALPSLAKAAVNLTAPPPPPPPPPPAANSGAAPKVKRIPRQFELGKVFAPREVPPAVLKIEEEPLPPAGDGGKGVVGGVPGGREGGVPGGTLDSIWRNIPDRAAAPPPPPVVKEAAKPAAVPQRIRVGGQVQQAMLVNQTRPIYPQLAKAARIQGVVRLSAVIGVDGAIVNLQVLSGPPMLIPAALDAVKQWRYRPTLLNGEPTEVATQIDVNFTLQ